MIFFWRIAVYLFCSLLAPSALFAAEWLKKDNFTFGVDLLSNYLSDGASKSLDRPILQSWGKFTPHKNWRIKAHLTPVDLPQGRRTQLSLGATAHWQWGPAHIETGLAQYRTFPFVYATNEAYLQVGGRFFLNIWTTIKYSRLSNNDQVGYIGFWQDFKNGWALSNYTKIIYPSGPMSYGADVVKKIRPNITASIGYQSRLPEDTPVFAAKLSYQFEH